MTGAILLLPLLFFGLAIGTQTSPSLLLEYRHTHPNLPATPYAACYADVQTFSATIQNPRTFTMLQFPYEEGLTCDDFTVSNGGMETDTFVRFERISSQKAEDVREGKAEEGGQGSRDMADTTLLKLFVPYLGEAQSLTETCQPEGREDTDPSGESSTDVRAAVNLLHIRAQELLRGGPRVHDITLVLPRGTECEHVVRELFAQDARFGRLVYKWKIQG